MQRIFGGGWMMASALQWRSTVPWLALVVMSLHLIVAPERKAAMTSPSMLNKLANMRSNAPYELPKTKLCANLIGTILACGTDQEISEAIELLKVGAGRNWSITQALQFLSGRQAEFAIDCAPEGERATLFAIHLLAKTACNEQGLGGASKVDGVDLAALRAMALNAHRTERAP